MQIYDFGLRLKKLRENKGLSQLDLASKLDIKKATISGYERNVTTPSLEIFTKLVYILGTSADYLLGINHKQMIVIDDMTNIQKDFIAKQLEFLKTELLEYDKSKNED